MTLYQGLAPRNLVMVEMVEGVLTAVVAVQVPYQMMITSASPMTQPPWYVMSGDVAAAAALRFVTRPGIDLRHSVAWLPGSAVYATAASSSSDAALMCFIVAVYRGCRAVV